MHAHLSMHGTYVCGHAAMEEVNFEVQQQQGALGGTVVGVKGEVSHPGSYHWPTPASLETHCLADTKHTAQHLRTIHTSLRKPSGVED